MYYSFEIKSGEILIQFGRGPPQCSPEQNVFIVINHRVHCVWRNSDHISGGNGNRVAVNISGPADKGMAPGALFRIGTGGGFDNHHPSFTADPSALLPAAQFFATLAERELERLSTQFNQRSDE